jgi:hypothetical protein
MRTRASLGVTLALLLGVAAPLSAQGASDTWQFTVAPYLMGASMSGTVGVADRTTTLDVSASEIFKNLQFGAMGIVAARKGSWGVGADLLWMALGTNTTTTPAASIDVNQGAFSFYGLRRLSAAAELTVGVRWNILQNTIRFQGPLGVSTDSTKQWFDPLVGLNLRTPETGSRWHAGLYTDIGGFGVGSKFAWQLFPTVGVKLTKRMSLDVGYRWLHMDYETGKNLTFFKYDVMTQGPTMGFFFRF